jgi:hypothetical protein
MHRITSTILFTGIFSSQLWAGTVVVTSVADPGHAQAPLTSLAGLPLVSDTRVQVGSFPGRSDDQILDLASQGGLTQITEAFVPFGSQCAIGQGVDGAAGGFEIAVKSSMASSSFAGQTISLLIQTAGGEFLVARFPDQVFEAESSTGLEPLLALHLADARVIVGNRSGSARLATSPAPSVGSFGTWLSQFTTLTEPSMKSPEADPDCDGRSNFLEYATGGDPTRSGDPFPCTIQQGTNDDSWVSFRQVTGLGMVRYSLESSDDLTPPWLEFSGNLEPNPEVPNSVRARLSQPLAPNRYFRLKVEGNP